MVLSRLDDHDAVKCGLDEADRQRLKTLSILGVVLGGGGVIINYLNGNYMAMSWAFTAALWALASTLVSVTHERRNW